MGDVIKLRGEYIKLGQALKAAGFVNEGTDAKYAILDELVKVNGEICTMRGKKLYKGDTFTFEGKTVTIEE